MANRLSWNWCWHCDPNGTWVFCCGLGVTVSNSGCGMLIDLIVGTLIIDPLAIQKEAQEEEK